MSLLRTLIDCPKVTGNSSRFTVLNGYMYCAAGLLLLTWPGAVQTLFFDPEFEGRESALTRVLGLTVVAIGWFYIFGGRSGARQIVAASVLNRMVLVPLVLLPLAISGVFPHLLLTFAILDPVLASIAWYLLKGELALEPHNTQSG